MILHQKLARRTARLAIRLGLVRPFVWLYALVIEEVSGPRVVGRNSKLPTVLALSPQRFRGDLEVLAGTGQIRILTLPFRWQTRLLTLFWPLGLISETGKAEYWHPTDPAVRRYQDDLRRFLGRFLPQLYRRLRVDAVLSPALHYVQDYDWGVASSRMGVPYIVLHRENLQAAGGAYRKALAERYRAMSPLEADQIIVHNEGTRQTLIDAAMISSNRTHALGCLRMDHFVRQLQEKGEGGGHRQTESSAKHVVLFSFPPEAGVPNVRLFSERGTTPGFHDLFDHVHLAIAELARERPEVGFTIKAKWGGRWLDHIESLLIAHELDPRDLENLKITAGGDPHELMFGASVVIGFGSTAILEAGAAGVPVVVPAFAEAVKESHSPYVYFKDEQHVFDVAESADHLKRLVLERLSDPGVDEERLEERRRLFERWVSGLDGEATRRYLEIILGTVHSHTSSVQAPRTQLA